MKLCSKIMQLKTKEYTGDDTDRLGAFKAAAALQQCTPEQALAGMLAKHIISLYDMCFDNENLYGMEICECGLSFGHSCRTGNTARHTEVTITIGSFHLFFSVLRTRSRHRRWRSWGLGDMSPTSMIAGFPRTENLQSYAILRKIALLAVCFRNMGIFINNTLILFGQPPIIYSEYSIGGLLCLNI